MCHKAFIEYLAEKTLFDDVYDQTESPVSCKSLYCYYISIHSLIQILHVHFLMLFDST